MFTQLIEQTVSEQFTEMVPHVKWADVVMSGGVVLAIINSTEERI